MNLSFRPVLSNYEEELYGCCFVIAKVPMENMTNDDPSLHFGLGPNLVTVPGTRAFIM